MHQPGARAGLRPGAGPFPMNPALAAPAGHHRTITVTRAAALRWWRAGYQAGLQAAEHEHQARPTGTGSSPASTPSAPPTSRPELDALLLEAIAALARLFNVPDHPANRPA